MPRGAGTAGCECVYEELVRERFVSQAQWQVLLTSRRRSFRANGAIAYPPAVRKAIVACSVYLIFLRRRAGLRIVADAVCAVRGAGESPVNTRPINTFF